MRFKVGYRKPRNPHVDTMRFRKHGVHKKKFKSERRKQKVDDKRFLRESNLGDRS